ncbi:MAG: NfeD family protein [Gammaproteobacteria bacterium]
MEHPTQLVNAHSGLARLASRTARGFAASSVLAFACLCGAVAEQSRSPETSQDAIEIDYGRVGYAHVEGVIDRLQHLYFQRAISNATEQGLDTLVVHIDTDGGEVFRAREMLKLALAEAGNEDGNGADREPGKGRLRLIAFVDFRAISAGALIAYGHEAIYLSTTASIGDIGVIFRSSDGKIEYAPEKIETVVRTLLTQAAETHGWPKGLLLKMTARNQTLYRVTLAQGRVEYVIEDDFPDFLARHPDIDPDDTQSVIEYRGKDRLLTLTGKQAVELGMATGLAANLNSLYGMLGVESASVVDLSPTTTENIASRLSLVAPLLAGLALLFLVFEIKTPGVGLWAALAAICGTTFLLAQYFMDLANNFELVLMGIGIALLIAEFLTMAGAGLLALAGGLSLFSGLVLAFLPNELDFNLSDERFLDALGQASLSGVASLAIMAFGMVGFIYALPRSRLASRVAVTAEITATSADSVEGKEQGQDAGAPGTELIGQVGTARENLRPGGMIDVGDHVLSATGEHGKFIGKGAAVEVTGMRFGEAVVREVEPDRATGIEAGGLQGQ